MATPAPELSPEDHVVRAINAYRDEARDARLQRLALNQRNRDAYHNVQDWTHKVPGQSREFLPKTSETVEQMAAFIYRGMVQFGDWFSVEAPDNSPLSETAIRRVLRAFLDQLPEGQTDTTTFATRVSDAVKIGLLESLMIFKIHGERRPVTRMMVERGEPVLSRETEAWKLQIDLIPPNDWYPDPTARGLYNIHEVERDLHDVRRLADQGVYDEQAVDAIEADFAREEEERRRRQDEPKQPPRFRRRVVLREFWGTILNPDGTVAERDTLCTVANSKHLIRPPEPFPLWHGQDPFVSIPLVRDPFTVWHKALYDDVVPLNLALNELFNLILDGGIASVWGVKELRMHWLDDPRQVSDGIPQGKTLILNDSAPDDGNALTQVTEGQVPGDALGVFSLTDREFNAAARTNDLKMGMLPAKQVKATEIVEQSQSQAVVLDKIVADTEHGLTKVLRKAWLTMMQNAEDLAVDDLRGVLSSRELLLLSRLTPIQRFRLFSHAGFKVNGLSATLQKARDFQRLMAVIQVAGSNPLLMGPMMRRFSGDKILSQLWKMMNLNPESYERTPDEDQFMETDMGIMQQLFPQLAGGGGQGNRGSDVTGEPGLPAEINQVQNPSDGL